MDLCSVFPQPEPVRLGEGTYLACALRIRDLARLQGWLMRSVPCPVDAYWPAIDGNPEGSELRRRALRDAFNSLKGWPVRFGSPEGRSRFSTPEGLRFFLSVALAEFNPAVGDEELDRILATVTVSQHGKLSRILFGGSPVDELVRLISPDSFPPDPKADEPVNWGELAADLAERYGWTMERIGDLRVTQLAAIRGRGKSASGKVEPPPGMGRFEFAQRQKRFFGPDREIEAS